MSINFTGKYPDRKRIVTGFTSFDFAVAGQDLERKPKLGIPTRCGIHLYGNTGIGKTTVALTLAGIISKQLGGVPLISPVDTFDLSNVESILNASGYEGEVRIELDDKSHEKTLKQLGTAYCEDDVAFAMLDSAYACIATSEREGDPGDSNMGRRAKMLGTFVRQLYDLTLHSQTDKNFIITNLLFPNIGMVGSYTPGGNAIKGLTSIHIKLTQARVKNKAVKFDDGRLLEGKIEKNNFGPVDRTFKIFVLGGIGIHRGLTAVYDAISYGLAEDGRTISIDGTKQASIKDMIENWKDETIFEPFYKVIEDNKEIIWSKASVKPAKKTVSLNEDDEEDDGEETANEIYNG